MTDLRKPFDLLRRDAAPIAEPNIEILYLSVTVNENSFPSSQKPLAILTFI